MKVHHAPYMECRGQLGREIRQSLKSADLSGEDRTKRSCHDLKGPDAGREFKRLTGDYENNTGVSSSHVTKAMQYTIGRSGRTLKDILRLQPQHNLTDRFIMQNPPLTLLRHRMNIAQPPLKRIFLEHRHRSAIMIQSVNNIPR